MQPKIFDPCLLAILWQSNARPIKLNSVLERRIVRPKFAGKRLRFDRHFCKAVITDRHHIMTTSGTKESAYLKHRLYS
ncbi:Zinc-regulated transporter 1 [Fusarium oxysporum f. sp. albedinis]|nr:Zinc-regulated transporter 1 [Fusarium oxysporum f. sp. albedinis]